MNTLHVSAVVIASAVASVAQGFSPAAAQAPSPPATFEVAAVRPNTSGDARMGSQTFPGGRYTATNIAVRALIINAYGLQDQQLVGAPDWLSSERFDIVAKADGELGPPVARGEPSRLQLMLRALLADRFKLRAHREPRAVPIYSLVRAHADGRLGPELKPATVDCDAIVAARKTAGPPSPPKPGERPQCAAHITFGEIAVGGQPLTELVFALVPIVGRTVVDKTGLTGNYDLLVRFTPDRILQRAAGTNANEPIRVNGVEIDPNGPSIFTALQEQLGLKLESERGTVDALVIDHIERPMPD